MSHDRIESRRAFMKKLSKFAGVAAFAVTFMTTGANHSVAKPDEDNPPTSCFGCSSGCMVTCVGGCDSDCLYSCYRTCKETCYTYCTGSCDRTCVGACDGSCRGSSYQFRSAIHSQLLNYRLIITVLQQEKIMSQDKIESRRAFMKKFGKLAGAAAVAAAFMATGSKDAEAKPSEDKPGTYCYGCEGACVGCMGSCKGDCAGGCSGCRGVARYD